MPAPMAYTEPELGQFLAEELTDIGTVLDWDGEHAQVRRAVRDTARLLGLTDVADATNAAQVERVGAVAIWRRACLALASRYTVAEDQQSFQRSDLYKHATANLARVEAAAMGDLPEYQAHVSRIQHTADPYAYLPDALRTL
jgi:hypothetical protein